MCVVPFNVPGGNPVTELPGDSPRSPVTMVGPVLVIVLPARTAKLLSVPRAGWVTALAASGAHRSAATAIVSALAAPDRRRTRCAHARSSKYLIRIPPVQRVGNVVVMVVVITIG